MTVSRPYIFIWTIVGLSLTIGANFVPVYVISSPLQWMSAGITAYPLGFKCQIGAVLLVSCLGGRTAGVLTQVFYILLGLLWLKIFNDGGGIEYLQKPAFGYLLAFVPGSWVCGQLAFKRSPKLEYLGLSCLCGLLTIHLFGLIYLILFALINWQQVDRFNLLDAIAEYSIYPLISQLVLACAATSISFVLRRVMFY
ncbi:biotin transporter BioY [Chamaesiphon sp. VAR_48_metabat_135_sub]|uniref:biotin transporter BioY n=1 Tax=Chamaesiphon sp. VAR_48_metabat_135_sub TaxID=2964699 RepID=UPI00286BD023|nr:biotin transporter BioY [Chamaesiphon sp. VAR_48_metabat_135_sub]